MLKYRLFKRIRFALSRTFHKTVYIDCTPDTEEERKEKRRMKDLMNELRELDREGNPNV